MKMWSFREWLSSKDIIFQANFMAITNALPYFLAFWYFSVTYTAMRPHDIPTYLNVLGGPLAIAAFGNLLTSNYMNYIKNEVYSNEPYNFVFWWNHYEAVSESNIVTDTRIIKELDGGETPELSALVQFIKQNPVYQIEYGEYFYHLRFKREVLDNNQKSFRDLILCSPFPLSKINRKVKDQLMIQDGMIMVLPTSYIICNYVAGFEEIGEKYRVFKVMCSPEHIYLDQVKMGVIPDTIHPDHIAPMAQLAVDNVATKWVMEANSATQTNKVLLEKYKTASQKALEYAGIIIENDRRIKHTGLKRWIERIPRKWLYILAGLALVTLIYYMYVRGGKI